MFPDGTVCDSKAWFHYCVEHDRAYWAGGTREERKQADQKLAQNLKAGGHRFAGFLVYPGTRLGGHPILPTSWRWGYAWKYPRGYGPLSDAERAALAAADTPK